MEIWDLYDEKGNKTGETWERSRAREIPEGRYHIVCDVLIRHLSCGCEGNRSGNIFRECLEKNLVIQKPYSSGVYPMRKKPLTDEMKLII